VGIPDGETVLAEAVESCLLALGDRLLAAYALGSLAHGGFSELVSEAGTDDARGRLPRPGRRELVVAGANFALATWLANVAPWHAGAGCSLAATRGRGCNRGDPLAGSPRCPWRTPFDQAGALPGGFLYTAATGRVGTNDAAVAHYLDDDKAPSRILVAAALAWRSAAPSDGAAAATLLRERMLPLYLHYIDDHIERLSSLSEIDLTNQFKEWRDRLVR
jgi:hypothetical protein